MSVLATDKVRFILGGGSNTLLSYLIYLVLQQFLEYRIAYTLAFAAGIVTGYAINTFFVFRKPWAWKALFAYPLVPLASYVASLLIVQISVETLGLDQRIAPLAATAIMLPLTYLATRRIVGGRAR